MNMAAVFINIEISLKEIEFYIGIIKTELANGVFQETIDLGYFYANANSTVMDA